MDICINKVRDDITKESLEIGNPLAQAVEEHLNKLCVTEKAADAIMHANAEGKTMKKLCNEIVAEAKSKAQSMGSRSMGYFMSEDEMYAIIDEYYGIDQDEAGKIIDITDLL